MSFTQALRQQAGGIFQAIFDHPFVKGIAEGNLEREQLIHYVKQDFEYLNAYMRIYGIAISKSTSREEIAAFNEQISFILHSEVHPHQNFCAAAGVTYEELQGYPLAPSAHHYIRHMLTVAHEGSLGEIMAVLLPCPWTYLEIGRKLLNEVKPDASHPFYDWISFTETGGRRNSQVLRPCRCMGGGYDGSRAGTDEGAFYAEQPAGVSVLGHGL